MVGRASPKFPTLNLTASPMNPRVELIDLCLRALSGIFLTLAANPIPPLFSPRLRSLWITCCLAGIKAPKNVLGFFFSASSGLDRGGR